MTRRRATPRLYRWSRPLIGAIALVGAIETTILTIVKLTGNVAAICPTDGCDRVLNSPYASVFGLPLTLFGFLGYALMVVLAIAPYAIDADSNRKGRDRLERITGWGLLVGGAAMASFSGYLLTLLFGELHEFCPYCLLSATLSFSLFGLAAFGREWQDGGQAAFTSVAIAAVTLTGVTGLYANIEPVNAANPDGAPIEVAQSGQTSPDVTTESGSAEIALARHLNRVGATYFGAYWCPHCYDQKQLFGREAARIVNYVECDPRGRNAQPQACRSAGVRAFPSWEIDGELYEGTRELEELAQLSGYSGSQNFRHSLRSIP